MSLGPTATIILRLIPFSLQQMVFSREFLAAVHCFIIVELASSVMRAALRVSLAQCGGECWVVSVLVDGGGCGACVGGCSCGFGGGGGGGGDNGVVVVRVWLWWV